MRALPGWLGPSLLDGICATVTHQANLLIGQPPAVRHTGRLGVIGQALPESLPAARSYLHNQPPSKRLGDNTMSESLTHPRQPSSEPPTAASPPAEQQPDLIVAVYRMAATTPLYARPEIIRGQHCTEVHSLHHRDELWAQ
jgi:hypothetical protein